MSDPGDLSWWFGSDRQQYDPNSAAAKSAASMGGAYGATNNLQQAGGMGTLGKQGPVAQAASAGPAQYGRAFTGQTAQLNTQNYDQARSGQMGLAGMLTEAANGRGPSGAGLAAQAQRDSALSQAAALQAGRRGRSAVAGAQMGTAAAQMGNQQASQNETIGRANEMSTARGQLGSVLGQVAGQDIGVAGQNAGFGQQMSMFNAGQQQGMSQFNAGQGQNMAQYNASNQQTTNLANQNADLAQQGLNQSLFLGSNQGLLGESQAEMNARLQEQGLYAQSLNPGTGGVMPGLLSAGTTLGAAALLSDANAKYGIQPTSLASSNYIPRGVVDPRDKGEKAGDALAQAANAIANVILTKRMESADKDAQRQKELDQYGGYTKNEVMKSPGLKAHFFPTPNQAPAPTTYGPPENPVSLPAFGNGGVVTKPTVALIGERGPEAVVPLRGPSRPGIPEYSMVGGALDSMPDVSRDDARDTLDKSTPYSFFYKPAAQAAGQAAGRQVGVMAQDLERSVAGKQLVGHDPQTGYKTVNYLRGLPLMFAGLADVNDRLARMERKGG